MHSLRRVIYTKIGFEIQRREVRSAKLQMLTTSCLLHAIHNTGKAFILEIQYMDCCCVSCMAGFGTCHFREYAYVWIPKSVQKGSRNPPNDYDLAKVKRWHDVTRKNVMYSKKLEEKLRKTKNESLQHSSRMCKRFKMSDFEDYCNNEMLTQEDDAEDKDGNYNTYETNEDELKNENGFCCSSRIQKMLQMSDIEDLCDDEPVVIPDTPEDRTDSDKRNEELLYNAHKLSEHRKLSSENSTKRSNQNSNEKAFSWNDLFKKVHL